MESPSTYDAYLQRKYFPELDGLRALCILLVIAVHMYGSGWLFSWLAGSRGVTIFFVLSGFLITTLGLREEQNRGTLQLGAFYIRRCCRLFPLYYLTLGLYCLFIFGLGAAPALRVTLAEAMPYYLLYMQEIPFFSWLIVAGRDVPFFHTWSLGIEEKFYLVWPLLAFVVWRGKITQRRMACLSFWAGFALMPFILPLLLPGSHILARCLFSYSHILAGCGLALLLHDRGWFDRFRFLGRGIWTAVALVAFLTVHFATPWIDEPALSGYAWHILYSLATSVLLAAILLGDGPLQRTLRIAPMVTIGKLSYAIYLVHILAMIAVFKVYPFPTHTWTGGILAFVMTSFVAIAVAWGLSILVERPGIALGRYWSQLLSERAEAPAGDRLIRAESA